MHDFLYKDGENLFITQLYIFKCLKKSCDRCDNAFVVIFFKTMYNKTIIRFGFCDIRNNQSLESVISLSLRLRLITLTSTLIIPDITKTSSNNCLLFAATRTFHDMDQTTSSASQSYLTNKRITRVETFNRIN